MRRSVRRLTAAAVLIAAGSWAPVGTASAHAELRESVPAAGAQLADPPPQITLRFTEPVDVLDDPIVLLDADGARIELGPPDVAGSVVSVAVPELPEGAYVVDWSVVSADGHPVAGAFTFTVGNAMPIDPGSIATSRGTPSSGWLTVWRAMTYAGFAVVLGIWAFVLTAWSGGRRDRILLALVTAGAGLALVGAILRVVTEASLLDVLVADLFDLRSGRAWLALVVLAALALGVAPLLHSVIGRAPLAAGWVAAAVAVGVAIAYAGHGAGGRVPLGGTVLTVVHVAAASVWIGGLVALARCVVAVDRATAWATAARFSASALVLVAVLAATGTVQGIRMLDGWSALTDSDFGRALLVKLGVIAALLTAAWVSRLAVRRSLARRPAETPSDAVGVTQLRWSVGVELVLAAAVFGVTGWLAGASPNLPEGRPTGPVTVTAQDTTGTATASATITPAAPGPNSIHLTIAEPSGREPDEVTIELRSADGSVAPIEVPAALFPGMVMSDVFTIPFAGEWVLTVDARYGDFDLLTFELPFSVG